MKTIVQKIKWESYVWLFYLPFTLINYLPIKSVQDIFWIVMIGLFLISYILVTEVPRRHYIFIPIELLITASFAIVELNFYMILFTAWQVSFAISIYKKRWYFIFLSAYYFILMIGFWRATQVYPAYHFSLEELMSLSFPIISPILSYVFAFSIKNRKRIQQNNRRLESIVSRGERQRIARDLHDTLGQSFSMITIKAQLAEKLFEKNSPQVLQELKDIEQESRNNLNLVRSIVDDLHHNSLSEMLLQQEKNLKETNVYLFTEHEEESLKWPTKVQYIFAAEMQEVITNIIRHAKASEVNVKFIESPKNYEIIVQDNGNGAFYTRNGSHGIAGMKARMQEHDGVFKIQKNKQGTMVNLVLPKEVHHD